MEVVSRPRVFLDVAINSEPAGRLTLELFVDKTPKTSENFRQLCTGEHDSVSYVRCPFHRVIDEFMIQGGDVKNEDGTGTYSIYDGKEFPDENLNWREIDAAGLVCSANAGKDTNVSSGRWADDLALTHCGFFITLEPSPHLNGKHTVFGRLVAGQDTLSKIAAVSVDKNDRPAYPVIVTRCGELEKKRKRQYEVPQASMIQDRGRRLSNDPDTVMENTDPVSARNRRTSDNAVDEGLRGRPRKRSKSTKDAPNDSEDKAVSDQDSPVKLHKRKRSSRPSRHLDRANTEDDQEYSRRRRRSLPNQHDDYRGRDRRDYRREGRGPRKHDHGRRDNRWSDYRNRRTDYSDQDSGRLTGHSKGDTAPAVEFKGRGTMKYRE